MDFSLQFESVPEDGRLRQNVMERGGVAPLGKTKNAQALLETMLTGKGEEFAFQRAVSSESFCDSMLLPLIMSIPGFSSSGNAVAEI